jgi:hypothetical protein
MAKCGAKPKAGVHLADARLTLVFKPTFRRRIADPVWENPNAGRNENRQSA